MDSATADVRFLFDTGDGSATQVVHAHKTILAVSDAFRSMFYGELKETGDIKIDDASYDAFVEFLQFFYLNWKKITLTLANIGDVMNLINKYLVSECFDVCDKFLVNQLSMDQVCLGYELATLHNRTTMEAVWIRTIGQYPREVLSSNSFKTCSQNAFMNILVVCQKACEIQLCTPMDIFNAFFDWFENQCVVLSLDATKDNFKKLMANSINLIPFKLMNRTQIDECVMKRGYLFDQDVFKEIMMSMAAVQ